MSQSIPYPRFALADAPLARGFALVEWLIVGAVIALLAGTITPGFMARLGAARTTVAERDVTAIGKALARFYKDVQIWPARNGSGADNQLVLLLSGKALPVSNPWGSSSFFSMVQAPTADMLDHHLFSNRPQNATGAAYPTGALTAWHGPYLDPIGNDPWGRPYVANVIAGWSSDVTLQRRLWVLSAGADGVFQTSPDAGVNDACAGDDVGFLVHLR